MDNPIPMVTYILEGTNDNLNKINPHWEPIEYQTVRENSCVMFLGFYGEEYRAIRIRREDLK